VPVSGDASYEHDAHKDSTPDEDNFASHKDNGALPNYYISHDGDAYVVFHIEWHNYVQYIFIDHIGSGNIDDEFHKFNNSAVNYKFHEFDYQQDFPTDGPEFDHDDGRF
jgi:hypothetical protein